MSKQNLRRWLAGTLALVMVLLAMPLGAIQARAEQVVYTLDATTDLTAFAQGDKADGDTEVIKDYFTLMYSAKNKVDGSNKTFDDGYAATQRLNFGGKTDPEKGMINSVKFTTANSATVKVWWVSGGDGRNFGLYDASGALLSESTDASVKNSLYISTLTISEAGTYYLGVPQGSNYLFKMEVSEDPVPVPVDHVLDATADLTAFAQGEKADGDTETFHDYFTVMYSAKNKVDGSNKTFDDGYAATQRLNFGGKTDPDKGMINSVKFTTSGPADVKIWWVSGGDGRNFGLYSASGALLAETADVSVKNSLYISTLAISEAGTYYVGVPQGSNYLFKLQVTETPGGTVKPPRAAWETVEAPVFGEITDDGEGNVTVNVTAEVGYDGGDEVIVTMYDAQGNELGSKRSIAEKSQHAVAFNPEASGTYTFKAFLNREGEQSKLSETDGTVEFVLPLATPVIASATSIGNGAVRLVWGPVPEAESYVVNCNGEWIGSCGEPYIELTDFTVGQSYEFTVAAYRDGEKSAWSKPVTVLITQEAQRVWGFTRYGSSTNDANNGYVGDLNADGKITVYSEGGKGKIVPNSTDGVAFYYTAIPSELNFTLRATVTVDSWKLSNGQEGFGIMAADRLGPNGDSASFWNNQYMALGSKIEYTGESGKYSMKLGLGSIAKTGLTPENLPTGAEMPETFKSVMSTLDHTPEAKGLGGGTYNIIGNAETEAPGTIDNQTTFILEIQKNNTGYFITYYDAQGNVIERIKNYDPDALSKLDAENVYVGFFASRNARITASDVVLTTIEPELDAPAEEKPVTYVQPAVSVASSSVTTSENHTISFTANVAGTATITLDGVVIEENVAISGGVRYDKAVTLAGPGKHDVQIVFTPDPDQDLGPDTQLESTDPITASYSVTYNAAYAQLVNLYVSPDGQPNAPGTREEPMDIYTAVVNVKAGQTIVVMEGTYALSSTVTIQKGVNGTEEAPIRMVADPQAASRPVFDFQGKSAGFVHGGSYWYFQGFDVTRSANGQKGFQLSGNHNVLDRINTYYNGNTGIQISRYSGADTTIDQWPSYNLVLNCTSYGNADAGYEDADGFAAKLTCGVGNVFDGCVAHHNADDGWDLYAKVETGSIGAVIIRNCVAYSNGYLEDGTNAGNGNGFKMGGESLSGKHQLINSYAFFNKAKGIDSNSCPDIIVRNSTSYNNESYNVAFYTNNASNTDFDALGIISFKDETIKSGLATGENLKPKGSQDMSKINNATNFYWNGTASLNSEGAAITADAFVSLEFKGVARNADGTIDLQGFLELKEAGESGANPGGTPSEDVELKPEPASAAIVGYTCSLGGNVALNFYAELSENLLTDPDAYMQFTFAGRTIRVPISEGKLSVKDGVTRYVYACPLASKNMTDPVTAQVVRAEGNVGDAKTMDVRTYCEYIIANSSDIKTVDLMKAMLNYGASAQMLFGYRTDDPANASLAESEKVLGSVDASAFLHTKIGEEEGIVAKSYTLLLDSETTVRVYFQLTGDKSIDEFTFTVDGQVVQPKASGNRWYIEYRDIPAHKLDEMHTFTCGGITITYSPLSYVNQVMTAYSSGDLFEMSSALYAYWQAAENYLKP